MSNNSTHSTHSAFSTLHQNEVDPHQLLHRLHRQKITLSYLNKETQIQWIYTARQRSRLFLLAKPDDMYSKYQDICSISLK
jgi:hypothetical protein